MLAEARPSVKSSAARNFRGMTTLPVWSMKPYSLPPGMRTRVRPATWATVAGVALVSVTDVVLAVTMGVVCEVPGAALMMSGAETVLERCVVVVVEPPPATQ